ncbi:hypothetical protein Fot_49809 [Forsythia ovata]|uniref:Uncharacterized protein n=1 Tax=Forsythia ovata TaxID=205694 RepID=A0ABD1QD16_9LAMI
MDGEPREGVKGWYYLTLRGTHSPKSSDNDQKRILAGLSLKGGEKDKDVLPASSDPRQTVFVPSASSQGLQIMVQKQELGSKRAEKVKAKRAGLDVGRSSKQPLGDDDDLEVLRKGTSSRSPQNIAAGGDGVPVVFEEEEVAEPEWGYDHSVHIKKIFQKKPSELSSDALDLLPTHLQRVTTSVDSF